MRVAIIASPKVDFRGFNRILPLATKEILTDGSGPTEKNAKIYCEFTQIRYREFPPVRDPYGIRPPNEHIMKMMNQADLIIILWNGDHLKPGRAVSSVMIDKMVHCYLVNGDTLCSLVPHPADKLKK